MVARGREFLERKGVESARLEAELLVAHALQLDRLKLFLNLERPVTRDEVARARELLVRRAQGAPTAYLVGEREFYGRPFAVGPEVLIPRPETELLVDRARERAGERQGLRVLDVGTGSGCIAISLALELDEAEVLAVDISPAALAVARSNAERLGAAVELLEGDGLGPAAARGPFDLIASNPPYVDPKDAPTLAAEVREHEPATALFAPAGDPDHWVQRLVREAPALLAPGGALLIELGADQSERALAIAVDAGLEASVTPDLAGIPRVLEASATPR
ncbi:MAG: peptide chain release factor N(5)-glutamine methyltransferase [Planctomycetota bacterium]